MDLQGEIDERSRNLLQLGLSCGQMPLSTLLAKETGDFSNRRLTSTETAMIIHLNYTGGPAEIDWRYAPRLSARTGERRASADTSLSPLSVLGALQQTPVSPVRGSASEDDYTGSPRAAEGDHGTVAGGCLDPMNHTDSDRKQVGRRNDGGDEETIGSPCSSNFPASGSVVRSCDLQDGRMQFRPRNLERRHEPTLSRIPRRRRLEPPCDNLSLSNKDINRLAQLPGQWPEVLRHPVRLARTPESKDPLI